MRRLSELRGVGLLGVGRLPAQGTDSAGDWVWVRGGQKALRLSARQTVFAGPGPGPEHVKQSCCSCHTGDELLHN